MIRRNATTTRPSGPGRGDGPADLGHVQRAGAAVDEGDAGQRQVGAHAVGDGEVQRALQRPAFFRPVGGQRVGRHAHQLEPDEQVEDVAGEAEADHARQEGQHQRVVVGGDLLEVPPGEDHRRGDQERGQAGQARAERPDGEVDADRDPVRRPEAGEPVDLVAVDGAGHEHGQHGRHRGGGDDGGRVQDPPPAAEQPVQRRQHRRGQQRHGHGQAGSWSGQAAGHHGSWSPPSALELDELLRVERAEPLVRLDREGQQQRGHGRLDHHVGQRERLHHGVHRRGVPRDVEEVRGHRAGL